MMLIADLSFLENVSENDLIFGGGDGVLVGVDAYASAEGDDTLAVTDATTKARKFRNGISIGWGRGKAVAVGENPTAIVEVDGEGDIVLSRTRSRSGEDTAVARGGVLAIDFPNR